VNREERIVIWLLGVFVLIAILVGAGFWIWALTHAPDPSTF
jgi:hypothetical protein